MTGDIKCTLNAANDNIQAAAPLKFRPSSCQNGREHETILGQNHY